MAENVRRWLGGLALLAALTAGTGCNDPAQGTDAPAAAPVASSDGDAPPASAPTTHPSIVLVTIDTLRADHVSSYGYPRPTTPNLDALAAAGARIETAYAVSSTTLPSHATLFTARYPDEHGVVKNGLSLPADVPVLAEQLQAEGYETAAIVSSFVLNRRFGVARGFDHYDDDFKKAAHSSPIREWEGHTLDAPYDRRGGATTERALRWLAGRKTDRPYFLWVHYFDPHSPYDPPEPHRSLFQSSANPTPVQAVIDLYDGDVHYADAQLGLLLEATSPTRPLTIVTSDHGEGLWDHGWLSHGVYLYEELVRVPWVMHWPGVIEAGQVVGGLTAHVDLIPSLSGLLGLGWPNPGHGEDLSGQIRGVAAPDPSRAVYLQRRHYESRRLRHLRVAGDKHAVRIGRWKLIVSPEELGFELFDLENDPGERENLAGLYRKQRKVLSKKLSGWQSGQHSRTAAPARPSDDDLARLRALGYVE